MAQNLEIVINAQDKTDAAFSKASRSLDSFSDKLEGMKPQFSALAGAGTVAFAAIAGVAVSTIKAFTEAEADMAVATQTVNNTLENMSAKGLNKVQQQAGEGADIFEYMAQKMNEAGEAAVKMGFDDEAASKSFAKLFSVTKDNVQAQKEMSIAMDLARYKGISLEDATQKLVMVHAGATKELKSLGIAVEDGATAFQNLDSIQKQVTGTAENYAKTAAGAIDILNVRLGNLQETVGGALAPAFTKLLDKIAPVLEKFQAWADKNPELIAKIILMGGAIAGLVAGVGLLGLALPAIIASFSLLLGPVGLVIAAIALVVINFDFLKQKGLELIQVLQDNGVFIYFHEIWTNIATNFQQNLLPALQQLWTALQPLVPYFMTFAKVLGVTFMVALMAVGKILEGWIYLFSMLLEAAVKIGTYLATVLKGVFDTIGSSISYVVDKVNSLINSLQSLWSSMSKFGGSAMSSIGGLFGGSTRVNDAIIQPNGRVITPANDDYIVATKNPNSLFGGNSGGAFNININGAIFTEDAATTLGNLIVDKFKTASRVGL